MLYRKFGPLDLQVSILGFGCMRLPVIDSDQGKIDEPEAIRMIRHAIDAGVNYVDSAYFYHKGTSEVVLGKALQDGYRDKVLLATKLPVSKVTTYADFDRFLNEQLNRLNTDHIDFYLMHGLNQKTWNNITKLGYEQFLAQAIADGRIRYPGFSFHDSYPLFTQIVDAYPWTFCQIQYNYMDTEFQAGTLGLDYAAAKGLAVVIMEPVKGGKLARNFPQDVQEIWNQSPLRRTPAEMALRWVWNNPKVSTVLSGMTTMEQVEENLQIADDAHVNGLSEAEIDLINKVKTAYQTLTQVDCTQCNYCQPCPFAIDIPRNFALYNDVFLYSDLPAVRNSYNLFTIPEARASACTQCGVCETLCPQSISIRDSLRKVDELLKMD